MTTIYSPNGADLSYHDSLVLQGLEPMTSEEASNYGPQWGIYNRGCEKEAIYYGSYPARSHSEARQRVLLTLTETLPRAIQTVKEGSNPDVTEHDIKQLKRLALFDIANAPPLVEGYEVQADRLTRSLIVKRLEDGLTSERLTGQEFLDVLAMDTNEAEGLFIDGLTYS